MLQAALDYAKDGHAVFPVGFDKKPQTVNGFKDATTDPDIINRWVWNEGIGMAIALGTFVVDVDPRHNGNETIAALRAAGCELPATRVVETKSGGQHRYYRLPEDMKDASLKGNLGPGVDIKAAGKGYVLVPPTPGYRVIQDYKVRLAPAWMLEELVKPSIDSVDAFAPEKFFPWEAATAYGAAALEAEIERLDATEDGGRNNALNRAAFSLSQLSAAGELSEQEAIERLEEAAERMGLPEAEAKATITSGWKAGLAEPRSAPDKIQEWADEAERGYDPSKLTKLTKLEDESRFWLDWDVDEPDLQYYLRPIVPKNAYILVYGATESSKSMAFVALACEGSHKGLRTSVYSLENPGQIDRQRVRRLGPASDNFRITNQMLDLNDARQVHSLIAREKSFQTDWVILDTYSHAFNSRSEDGNAKAISFAQRIRYIMAQVGCTVIVVDHTGYADHGEPRDASAKRQAVDVAIKMEKQGEWSPGRASCFTMRNHKAARFGNPFEFTGEIHGNGSDPLSLRWRHAQGGKMPKWEV